MNDHLRACSSPRCFFEHRPLSGRDELRPKEDNQKLRCPSGRNLFIRRHASGIASAELWCGVNRNCGDDGGSDSRGFAPALQFALDSLFSCIESISTVYILPAWLEIANTHQ